MKRLLLSLIILSPLFAIANDQKVGDWMVTSTGDYYIAKVFNATNNTAGVLCSKATKSCSTYVTFGLSCESGSKYSVMMNSSVGSSVTSGTCVEIEKSRYFFLDDGSGTLAAFESGGEIGFVTPTQAGTFQVVRFSTSGATAAIRMAREAAMKGQNGDANHQPASQQI